MTRTAAVWWTLIERPGGALRVAVLVAFAALLFLGNGCAARQSEPAPVEEPAGIERPAVPLSEEEGLADRIGQVGVVLLVVGIALALIVIPILLL